jgi:hypothetical protein
MSWPLAFLLTLTLEIPVVLLLLARGWRKDLPLALLANGLTHPTLWFVLPSLFSDYLTFLIVGELAVFTFEALLYACAVRSWKGVAAGVAANSLSLGVGLLLQQVL